MERKIRFIETELKKDSITIPEIKEIPKAPNTKDLVVLEVKISFYNDLNFKCEFYILGSARKNRIRHERIK